MSEKTERDKHADTIIKNHIIWSMGAGLIPVIGSVIRELRMSHLAGASSYALGEVFKKNFDTGETFLDFDVKRLKKMYDEKYEKGKKVAEQVSKEQEMRRKAAEETITNKS